MVPVEGGLEEGVAGVRIRVVDREACTQATHLTLSSPNPYLTNTPTTHRPSDAKLRVHRRYHCDEAHENLEVGAYLHRNDNVAVLVQESQQRKPD